MLDEQPASPPAPRRVVVGGRQRNPGRDLFRLGEIVFGRAGKIAVADRNDSLIAPARLRKLQRDSEIAVLPDPG